MSPKRKRPEEPFTCRKKNKLARESDLDYKLQDAQMREKEAVIREMEAKIREKDLELRATRAEAALDLQGVQHKLEKTEAALAEFQRPVRLYEFPWLRKMKTPSMDVVENVIIPFLNDDDLFRLRTVNSMFYKAYFGQRITRDESKGEIVHNGFYAKQTFNAKRAISLAKRGRRFPRVELLDFCDFTLSREHLAAVNPDTFPRLKSLDLYATHSLTGLPPQPTLKHAIIRDCSVTNEKFPALETLLLEPRRNDRAGLVYFRLTSLPTHETLRELRVNVPSLLGWFPWSTITRDRLPSLERVNAWCIPRSFKRELTTAGVQVEQRAGFNGVSWGEPWAAQNPISQ